MNIKGLGKCGYVANSPYTVQGKSMSAGRLYDKIGDIAKGKIIFVIPGAAICKVTDTGLNELKEGRLLDNEDGENNHKRNN